MPIKKHIQNEISCDPVVLRSGTINFFDLEKNYGSVCDRHTRHNYIFYGHTDLRLAGSHCVHFTIEKTSKGLVAVNIERMD